MLTSRLMTWIAVTGVLVLAACRPSQPGPTPTTQKSRFTIGPDTTCITGPTRKDGTIDYVAAYNARLGAGVTGDNNAAVLIVRVLGPTWLPEPTRARVLAALNLGDLPPEGPYFADLTESSDALFTKHWEEPWRNADEPDLAALLKASEAGLEILTQAAERPRYWMPCCCEPADAGFVGVRRPSLHALRRPEIALAARAMLRLGNGDVAGSHDDLLALHRLSRLALQAGTPLDELFGVFIDGVACRADLAWACDSRVTAALAKEYLSQLEALPAVPSAHDLIDTGTRFLFLDGVMELFREAAAGNPARPGGSGVALPSNAVAKVDWDGLLRAGNQWYDRMAAINEDLTALGAAAASEPNAAKRLHNTLLSVILYVGFDKVSERREWGIVRFELTEIAVAARAFYGEKGKWPQKLTDLVPAYFKAIPTDRFTNNQPLHMQLEDDAMVIWSVGPDGNGRPGDTEKGLAVKLRVK